MTALSQHPAGKAQFTETKTLSVLKAPLISTGELIYSPPDRLEKNTLTPKPESLLVEHNRMVLVRDGRSRSLHLQQYPEVLSIVEAVRGTLVGNRNLLEQHYALDLTGNQQGWQLTLKPQDDRMKRWVRQIVVIGKSGQITSIETQQSDGDRSVLLIEPER